MSMLIPVLNGSTNWGGERMSTLSFDGFNSPLPEGPAESSVHSPEWACICLSCTQHYLTNSNVCSQFPVFFFKETGRPVVPQQGLHLMEPPLSTLRGATALSLRTWDLLTLKKCRLFETSISCWILLLSVSSSLVFLEIGLDSLAN